MRPVQLQLAPPQSEASTPLSASLSAATPLSAFSSAQLVAIAVPPIAQPVASSLALHAVQQPLALPTVRPSVQLGVSIPDDPRSASA